MDSLDRDGWMLAARALDDAWVLRLRRAFDAAPAQERGTQHVRLGDDTPEIAAWRALESHPAIVAAAERVLAAPFRVRDLHGRNPLPGYGEQGLHADAPAREGGAFAVVTAIVMIDDFTIENGATRVVPGTHHLLEPIPKRLAQPGARHPREIVVTGRAGDVLVFNGHLWHSGRKNASVGPRRAGQMVVVRG